MKKLVVIIAIASATLMSLQAQTVTVGQVPNQMTNLPVQVQPFINTLANWGTSYNTNNILTNGWSLDTGVATTTGQSISDRLTLADRIGRWEVGASAQFTGVGSAFSSAEAFGGYALIQKYDFALALEIGVGYDFNKLNAKGAKGALLVDPELAAYKLITRNTYATAKYGFPWESVGKFNNIGVFYIGTGFTF